MVKNPPVNSRDPRDTVSILESGRSPGVGNGNPFHTFLPGKFHGLRNQASFSPWGCKQSDMTDHAHILYDQKLTFTFEW